MKLKLRKLNLAERHFYARIGSMKMFNGNKKNWNVIKEIISIVK